MTYRIEGLPRGAFARYYGRTAEELLEMGAIRVVADANDGFPCRVTLQDAREGDSLILLNYISHDVPGPYRTAYAIFVREHEAAGEGAGEGTVWADALPPILQDRVLSLRAFDADGLLHAARLAQPDAVGAGIADLFAEAEVAYIHAHYATYGCFAARIERDGEAQ